MCCLTHRECRLGGGTKEGELEPFTVGKIRQKNWKYLKGDRTKKKLFKQKQKAIRELKWCLASKSKANSFEQMQSKLEKI